ncbi:MAG: hypothetical protein QNJ78_16370 [Gammaproteobacteria bacterium]|nr:hypothetical protein [Gammaproteobacteria bacterium]
MSDAQDALADLSMVAEATEQLSLFLENVGIGISVFGLQVATLSLTLAVFIILLTVAWNKTRHARYAALAGLTPLALVIMYILASWLGQWLNPLPDYVSGRVVADDLHDMTVGLLGFRNEPFAAGPEYVDSITGRFALNYQPRLGDYPRRLLLKKPGCGDSEFPISQAGLKSQQRFILEFVCRESP